MPAGDHAEGKARYRRRVQKDLTADGETISLHSVGERLAERRRKYATRGLRTFEEMYDDGYELCGEFEGRIQQLNSSHVTIVTLHVPDTYISELMDIKKRAGSLWFRVYAPPAWDAGESYGDDSAA